MADYGIPKSGVAYIFYGCLVSQADTKLFKSAPTLAAGDFKVSIDGGAFANLATLPTNTPGTFAVKFSLSSAEMTGDNILVVASDAAGAEWCDQCWNIQTSPRGIADLAYPATTGRSLAVDASGRVLSDVDTIKTNPVVNAGTVTFPTTATLASTTNITAGTIATVTNLTNLPSIPANWITAAGITAAALNGKGDWPVGKTGYSLTATTGLGNQTSNITGSLSGSVGSVTGAVGSVTGNVGGNVTGSVGSVTGLTNATIADQVWDEALAGHVGAGSTGAALNAAGAAGDPWTIALPGAYGAGTAGFIVGTNLDATVSSVKAKTDNLPAAPAAVGDIPTAVQNADALLGRNVAGGSSAGRTVKEALYVLRNKTDIAGGTLTVYGTDDSTPAFTAGVTTSPGDPISAIDPA